MKSGSNASAWMRRAVSASPARPPWLIATRRWASKPSPGTAAATDHRATTIATGRNGPSGASEETAAEFALGASHFLAASAPFTASFGGPERHLIEPGMYCIPATSRPRTAFRSDGLIAGLCVSILFWCCPGLIETRASAGNEVRKLADVVIYEDSKFYSAFPSIVRRPNGELLVGFRRAPDRRLLGEPGITHTDPNSQLVLVRSGDGGKSWSREPQLIFAHPFGGSQDPCLVQLRDGAILCSSYGWARSQPDAIARLKQPVARAGDFVFLGGYLLRSRDGGKSWQGPIVPPPCPGEVNLDLLGRTVPAYNRGAMCEGKDGRLYWVVPASSTNAPQRTGTHLLISADQGQTWDYSCPVAQDEKIVFNETSLYETPKGALVAFVRTEGFNDHTVIVRAGDHSMI